MQDIDARADTIRLQPDPINCRVAYVGHEGHVESAIAREWRLEDAERCTLCPDRCRASVSVDGRTAICLMVARGFVSLEDARLFRPGRFVPDGMADDDGPVAAAVAGVQGGAGGRGVGKGRGAG